MGKEGRLRCKNSGAVERQLGRQLAPYSKERRSLLCSVATAGAGLAGSAILSLSAETSPKAFAATGFGNSRVLASDKTVAATTAGKTAACVRRPAFEQASRKAALRAAPAYSYIYAWRTPGIEWPSGLIPCF
jgi:hypothetical protein